jgi:hypothetical protein
MAGARDPAVVAECHPLLHLPSATVDCQVDGLSQSGRG